MCIVLGKDKDALSVLDAMLILYKSTTMFDILQPLKSSDKHIS